MDEVWIRAFLLHSSQLTSEVFAPDVQLVRMCTTPNRWHRISKGIDLVSDIQSFSVQNSKPLITCWRLTHDVHISFCQSQNFKKDRSITYCLLWQIGMSEPVSSCHLICNVVVCLWYNRNLITVAVLTTFVICCWNLSTAASGYLIRHVIVTMNQRWASLKHRNFCRTWISNNALFRGVKKTQVHEISQDIVTSFGFLRRLVIKQCRRCLCSFEGTGGNTLLLS